MKATSYIFQSIAPPVTVFGLPPLLAIVLVAATMPLVPILSIIGLSWLSLIGPVILILLGALYLWKLRRKEPHCETIIPLPNRFFKGKKTRTLVVGENVKQFSQ